MLRSEVGFYVEDNSSSSIAVRMVLAENNAARETNFMALEFVRQPSLCNAHNINVRSAILFMGEPSLNISAIPNCVFMRGRWGWGSPQVGALNLDHHEAIDGQSFLHFFFTCLELTWILCQLPYFSSGAVEMKMSSRIGVA